MLRVESQNGSITVNLSSERRLVGRVLLECSRFLERHGLPEQTSLELVLRELLLNAIEHGNENAPERRVMCHLERLEDGYRLVLEDEGRGFDPSALDVRLPDGPFTARRGYMLVNALSDSFELNERGNRVTAYFKLNREETGKYEREY